MGWLTFLSISMYCLNNETRSTFVTRQVPSIVFIYISNPTFPLFKNRFSDNLRLFKNRSHPYPQSFRFFYRLSLFVRIRLKDHLTVVEHTATMCGTMRVASSRWGPRSFIFPLPIILCLPSYGHSFPSLNTELEHGASVPHVPYTYGMERVLFLCIRDSTPFHPLFFVPFSPRGCLDVCKSCLRTC